MLDGESKDSYFPRQQWRTRCPRTKMDQYQAFLILTVHWLQNTMIALFLYSGVSRNFSSGDRPAPERKQFAAA
jgi:hypothetical protein